MTLPDWNLVEWCLVIVLANWAADGLLILSKFAWEVARAVWHYGKAR